MRNWLMLVAVATSMMHVHAGAQEPEPKPSGSLPPVWIASSQPTRARPRTTRFLGSLAGVGDVWDTETNLVRQAQVTVTLGAVSASLPGDSTVREKGLELRLAYLGNQVPEGGCGG